MRVIKKVLHEKRKTTEDHIKQLQHEGKQGICYTAMMPDARFARRLRREKQ
jgi:antitoxin component HigA of HigAB toxin-antitoxin module